MDGKPRNPQLFRAEKHRAAIAPTLHHYSSGAPIQQDPRSSSQIRGTANVSRFRFVGEQDPDMR